MTTKIQIENLPGNLNRLQLRQIYAQFGTVTSALVAVDPVTGRSKHTGRVTFETSDAAERAIGAGFIEHQENKITARQA